MWAALTCGLLALMAVNAAVRSLGGDPSLFAVRRFPERSEALGRLGFHWLRSVAELHCEDAQTVARRAARRAGLPEALVLAVTHVESDFVHTRVSATGAMGLMQLMPRTAQELGVHDAFDPRENTEAGARYLSGLVTAYRGDVKRALAAYNAGQSNVPSRGLRGVPGETLAYVSRVLRVSRSAQVHAQAK